jgi:hypothetical protein
VCAYARLRACRLAYPACKVHMPYWRYIYWLQWDFHPVSPTTSLAPPYFSTLHYTGATFGKTLLNTKCVFWLSPQLLSKRFPILRKIRQDIVVNVKTSSSKVPVILIGFQRILNFLCRFSKKTHIPNFIKIRPVGDELFRAEGRKNMPKLIVAFGNLQTRLKNVNLLDRHAFRRTPFLPLNQSTDSHD